MFCPSFKTEWSVRSELRREFNGDVCAVKGASHAPGGQKVFPLINLSTETTEDSSLYENIVRKSS